MTVRSGAQETRQHPLEGGWVAWRSLIIHNTGPYSQFAVSPCKKNGPETEVWRFHQLGTLTSQAPSAEGESWGLVGAAGPQPTPQTLTFDEHAVAAQVRH